MLSFKNRFTLLELLIVIAVLGVLITLLLPSLRKAKEASEKAVCASNYQQIFVGSMLSTKNNNLGLPLLAMLGVP